MKKDKSSSLWWLISPTYKYAEKKKHELIDKECTKDELSSALKSYNTSSFIFSIIIFIAAGLLIPLGNYLYEGGFYNHELLKYVLGLATLLLCWLFLLSRAIEIFKAFLTMQLRNLMAMTLLAILNMDKG